MALTFCTGKTHSGMREALFRVMLQKASADPAQRVFIVVPEQSTMSTQREVVRLSPNGGIMNLEVTSLNRLAYRVFAETGHDSRELLGEMGKSLLLEKTVLEEKGRLVYFGNHLTRPENIEELKSAISELMLYGISPDELRGASEEIAGGDRFRVKIQDIAHIYRAFLDRIDRRGSMTAEEVPDRFAAVSEESELLRGSILAFDGFTGFTPVQVRLFGRLLSLAREVYVNVIYEGSYDPGHHERDRDLFAFSRRMMDTLSETARERKIGIRVHSADRRPGHRSGEIVPELFSAANPRAEVRETARQIRRLVREEGYRYRDIAVVTGDLETYGNCVRDIFRRMDIPYFIDEKRSILSNPFIEYLRAALAACAEGYSYEGMFRMLKCGMTGFDRDTADHLENYALGTGLAGKKRWHRPFVHAYRGEDPAELPLLNELRGQICELIDPLSDALADRSGTVRDKAAAVYEFCVRSGAERKLNEAAERFGRSGRPDLAREYVQVYPYVCGLLDKMADVLGDEKISMKDFRALLEAGLSEARIAIIPPGNDRVAVGDVERSRIGGVKALFFIGVNEGVIPRPAADGGILTEADRARLSEKRIRLKPSAREEIYIGRFYLYLTVSKPSERLFLSESRAGLKGEPMHPAYLFDRARRMFPDLMVRDDTGKEDVFALESPENGLRMIAEAFQKIPEQEPGNEILELWGWYNRNPEYRPAAEKMLEAASARTRGDRISRAAAKMLYGDVLRNSATRLEEFWTCEFAHFLDYGLRLRERPEYRFTGLDLGNLMHRALEMFTGEMVNRKIPWEEAGTPEVLKIADACVARAAGEAGGDSVLYSSERNAYQIRRMTRLMETSVQAIGRQMSAGDFRPSGAEAEFRSTDDMEELQFALPGGEKMILTGRIDRIDTCEDNGRTLVRIVDYKTGNVRFDLNKVYYGLQLQLALYMNLSLEILRRKGKYPVPAGMYYYRIQDPVVSYVPDEAEEKRESRILREMKSSGVSLDEPDALARQDHALAPGVDSDVIPAGYKKDGSLKASSGVLSQEEFASVMYHVRRKIREAGVRILEGGASVNPCVLGKENACTYCPYRPVCGFDLRIPGTGYRVLPVLDKGAALAAIESENPEGRDTDLPESAEERKERCGSIGNQDAGQTDFPEKKDTERQQKEGERNQT